MSANRRASHHVVENWISLFIKKKGGGGGKKKSVLGIGAKNFIPKMYYQLLCLPCVFYRN